MIALLRFWKQGLAAVLLIVVALTWASKASTERENAKLKLQLSQAEDAIVRIEEQVRARTDQARAQDMARAARTERRQQDINEEIGDEYRTKLDALRQRYDALRLRSAAASADPGGGGKPNLPSLPDAASRADGASQEDRLPAADALIASEQALRLNALQKWVKEQAGVER